MLLFVIGIPAMADQPGLNDHKRDDKQWELSLGIAECRRMSHSKSDTKMVFSTVTAEIKKFKSPKISIGYELSTAFQVNSSSNTMISLISNYERDFLHLAD